MFALIVQTVLLFAIVFILGCVIGSLLRRFLKGGAESATRSTTSTNSAAAIAHESRSAQRPPIPANPVEPPQSAKVEIPPADFADAGLGQKSAPAKKARPKSPKQPEQTKEVSKAGSSVPAAVNADNLKLIRGIGPQNEKRLNSLGVNSFAQIASWSKRDQTEFGEALSFPGRIEREEWVSQAKVLAKGGITDFSKRVRRGDVKSSAGDLEPLDKGTKPSNLLSEPRDAKPDKFTLIDGVGNALEKKLFRLGIYHFDQIAQMSDDELTWLGHLVGFPGRPKRENWAGEARILASGEATGRSKPQNDLIRTSHKSND